MWRARRNSELSGIQLNSLCRYETGTTRNSNKLRTVLNQLYFFIIISEKSFNNPLGIRIFSLSHSFTILMAVSVSPLAKSWWSNRLPIIGRILSLHFKEISINSFKYFVSTFPKNQERCGRQCGSPILSQIPLKLHDINKNLSFFLCPFKSFTIHLTNSLKL